MARRLLAVAKEDSLSACQKIPDNLVRRMSELFCEPADIRFLCEAGIGCVGDALVV
jgi:hypothetical protein